MNIKTFAFIDASNLFYGGLKSLGWKIDYKKLLDYLRDKYGTERVLYFGGVEIHDFEYDYLKNESVPIKELEEYLFINHSNLLKNLRVAIDEGKKINVEDAKELEAIENHIGRTCFYLKLKEFGYELYLKPVKFYYQENGSIKKKANCDVEMAFYLMKEKDNFDRAVVLSGDGDFLPVLKYLKDQGKEIIILARGPRAAKEIRGFAGGNFTDFVRLRKYLEYERK